MPRCLGKIFTVLGFTSKASFTSLEESDLSEVYQAIEKKMQEIASYPDNDKLKQFLLSETRELRIPLESYKIPIGHKMVIKTIHDHFRSEVKV